MEERRHLKSSRFQPTIPSKGVWIGNIQQLRTAPNNDIKINNTLFQLFYRSNALGYIIQHVIAASFMVVLVKLLYESLASDAVLERQ